MVLFYSPLKRCLRGFIISFFVLWDELDKMRTARKARTFGAAGLWHRWKTSAQLIGMLLIRAMERAERVHGAMCSRGWDGRVRTLAD